MRGFPQSCKKPPSCSTCLPLDFAWGAPQLLREHDFNGLFLSLIKKLLVISFFYAVLINGQVWIPAIVNSFAQLGATAAGVSAGAESLGHHDARVFRLSRTSSRKSQRQAS